MALKDCDFCEIVSSCGARVDDRGWFQTLVIRLLCGIGSILDSWFTLGISVAVNGLVPEAYDKVHLDYDVDGNNTGVIYSLNGVTVATLALTYDVDDQLTDVERV